VRYWKKIIFTIIIVVVVLFLIAGIPEGSAMLFFFPMLAITFFVSFYLYKQSAQEEEERLQKGLQYIAEDIKAEKWIKTSFAPDALTYIKANRWMIILYSFLFLLSVTFLWSYLTSGFLIALKNFAYAGILFWTFIMYILIAPYGFSLFENILPKSIRRYFKGDWGQGYIFLLPITFYVYLLFPYETLKTELANKISMFPFFFVIYTSFFICIYCIVTLYQSIQQDEQKRLDQNAKKIMKENN
jgi:hypothetical protein